MAFWKYVSVFYLENGLSQPILFSLSNHLSVELLSVCSVLTKRSLGDICLIFNSQCGALAMICVYCILFDNYMFRVCWSLKFLVV